MKSGAGAWLDTGETAAIAYGRGAAAAQNRGPDPALRRYYPLPRRDKIASLRSQ
jgi:hypothetical protein